jgi:hypothetical protein
MSERVKIAMLASGELRNFKYTLKNVFNNFILPNNMDVYVLLDSYGNDKFKDDASAIGRCEKYNYEDDKISDEDYIRRVLGDKLKYLEIRNLRRDPSYNEKITEYVEKVKVNITLDGGTTEGNSVHSGNYAEHCIRQYYNQYLLYNTFMRITNQNFENLNNIKREDTLFSLVSEKAKESYDYVMKFRFDMVNPTRPIGINIAKDNPTDIFIPGMSYDGNSILYMQDIWILCRPKYYGKILETLLNFYGSFRYRYYNPNFGDFNVICVPEYNLPQAVCKFVSENMDKNIKISDLPKAVSGELWDHKRDCSNTKCLMCRYYEFAFPQVQ